MRYNFKCDFQKMDIFGKSRLNMRSTLFNFEILKIQVNIVRIAYCINLYFQDFEIE